MPQKVIDHFNHRHQLVVGFGDVERVERCFACKNLFEGFAHHCSVCKYYLHESCADLALPAKIQHFYHSSHPLALHAIGNDETVICNVCKERLMGFTYCCNDCDFNVDVLCAKLQPEIQLSIHPDQPLRLLQIGDSDTETDTHFFCDFCNNRCYSDRGQTFRCEICNFKIDLDCARMLLNTKHVQHVTHEHWLTVNWVLSKDRKYCAACRKVCDGKTYGCNRCCFFLHKTCTEYPTEIQLYFHSEHPLTLHSGTTKERERCDFCNLICQALTFRCELCNFKIHFTCARMLNNCREFDATMHFRNYGHLHSLSISNTKINDVYKHKQNALQFHNHPLAIVYNISSNVYCIVCGRGCNGPTYVCFLCRLNLHYQCLQQLQTICQNSFHKHPLVIMEESLNNFASCSACGEPCLDRIYICLTCKFYFHEFCLALPKEIQHFIHPCPLTLRQETTKFTCGACGKIHTQFAFHCGKCHFYLDVECAQNYYHQHPLILNNKEMNDDVIFCHQCNQVISGEIYGCRQCDFYLHRSCAAVQQQIKHPFHPDHHLTLCYDDRECCAVSILKTLDESGEVKYLRHKHFAIHSGKENKVCCALCEKNSCGPSYDCIRCEFFIHQNCLEPATDVQHPFHLHDLPISVSRKTHPIPKFSCDACHCTCSGFSYQCLECKEEKKFEMDVHCASLKHSIIYKGHKHFLTFFEKMDDDPQCEVCKYSYRDASYLRCVECDFTVHLLCVPLPCTIKHKCHIHPLHLIDYFVEGNFWEDDSDDYYCDACENIRDPQPTGVCLSLRRMWQLCRTCQLRA